MSFAAQIESGDFILISELDPPKGIDLDHFLKRAQTLKGRVDAIAVTDSEHAVMRMSPAAPCRVLGGQNIEPILTVSGRDRNRISLQADLLGAWVLGLPNIILKLGIDPDWGDQPMVRSSGDLDLETMARAACSLNAGKDLGGESLNGSPSFTIGAALDPSDDIAQNRKLAEKLSSLVEMGVSFIVLGPTYDRNIIDLFIPHAEKAGVKLFATLMPLKSVAMIRYLNNLAGTPTIPHEFLKQMMDAPVKAEAGISIASSFYRDIEDCCGGVVLNALGWGGRLPRFLDSIGR